MTAERLPIHALIYGEAGTFKSTLASTLPKPMVVWMFEPYGNEAPYLRLGNPGPLMMNELGFSLRQIMDQQGNEIARIEYYHDKNPENPTPSCWDVFRTRMAYFHDEIGAWRTAVFESVDYADIAARNAQQFIYNPEAKDPRRWRAEATDQIENMVVVRFAGFPINLAVLTHVDKERDERHGTFVRSPSAPGRLRSGLVKAFSEVYHAYMVYDSSTQTWVPQIQTKSDDQFVAKSTMLNAPNPCWPQYDSLWANYDAQQSQ